MNLLHNSSESKYLILSLIPGGLMVPFHVTLGMNGAIMVLPRKGLSNENGNVLNYDKAMFQKTIRSIIKNMQLLWMDLDI